MRNNVFATKYFKKELKRLYKKYPSLKNEYSILVEDLKGNPKLGVSIGNNCYKIRFQIKSKRKGKSGGARVITCFISVEKSVYLLSIYDKSEKENVTDKELRDFIKQMKENKTKEG